LLEPPDGGRYQSVLTAWESVTTPEERRAFHDACCNSSIKPEDLALMESVRKKLEAAVRPGWK
jgi:hypothetical protein